VNRKGLKGAVNLLHLTGGISMRGKTGKGILLLGLRLFKILLAPFLRR